MAMESDPPAIVEFGGPEAISRMDLVAFCDLVLDRHLKVQRMPRPVARLGLRLLSRPNDAMASVLGLGLLQDLHEATWDDKPLRDRGITPKPATDFLREQAEQLG